MAKQQAQAVEAQATTQSDFTQLLEREFRPKTDQARAAVEHAVQTLAEQALAQSITISDDAYKSIAAIIAQIDHKLSEQINQNSVTFSTPTTQGHIDLQGASHFDKATGVDIPTPHVQTRKINIGPNGQVTTSKKTEVTKAATKQDIRVARELARRKGLCK